MVRYEINRGGNVLKVVDANTLSATVDTLTANTAYDVSVGAFDAAGNASQQSNVVAFTTPPQRRHRSRRPCPGNLRSTGVTANSVSLAWNASTDNSGSIAGYDVYQGSTKVAIDGSLTATVTGLTPNTQYTFTVKARDPDGNASGASNAVTVRTASTGTGGIPEYDKDIAKVDLGWSVAFLPDDGSALVTERDRFEVLLVTAAGQKTTLGQGAWRCHDHR